MPRRNTGPKLTWLTKRASYYIVWYELGKERLRATGTADERQAQDALADFIRQRRLADRAGDPLAPEHVTIADVLDLYGTGHAPEAADPARIGYAIAALLPFWGERSVSAIGKDTCREYAKQRGKADATIRRELGTLAAALNYAVGDKLLSSAPSVPLPPKPAGKDRWLTRAEAAALLNAARTARGDVRLYLPLFIVIGLYTGARKEAILSLRWPQIDFEAGRINFKKVVDDAGDTTDRGQTNKSRQHIPIPARLMTFLRLARKRGSDIGYVVHDSGKPINDIGGGWDGNMDDGRYVQGSFGRACKRAGIVGVTPHTLRHTCGTWLAQGGVSLLKIGGWLGHSDSRTTQLYAHHHPDYQEEARTALDRRVTRTVARTRLSVVPK